LRQKIFTSLVCATQETMPKKKRTAEHAAGTHDITQFFGAASPSQGTGHNPLSPRSAALSVQRPAQRNLKLGQIEARSGAAGGARQARQSTPRSDSGGEELGEELLYSGNCTVLCI
jgi:hypothetical protein